MLVNYNSNNGLSLRLIKPFEDIDQIAVEALNKTQKELEAEHPKSQDFINKKPGLTSDAIQVVDILNRKNNLDSINRFLLSSDVIYVAMVRLAKEEDNVSDVPSLCTSVLNKVAQQPRRKFLAYIAADVFKKKLICITQINTESKQKRLKELLLSENLCISINQGELIPSFMKLFETFLREGDIPFYVDGFLDKYDTSNASNRLRIKRTVIEELIKLNAFTEESIKQHLPTIYNEAKKLAKPSNTNDPLKILSGSSASSKLNFSVNRFDEIEQEHQEIVKANIQAAGMLDYVYYFDCHFHVFDVANLLVIRWASGTLDIPEGKTAEKLYRFHKLRDDRNSPEERAMLYKRVLNKGDGQLLQNMVVNEAFPIYWEQLMSEMLQYIQKSENKSHLDSLNNNAVSRTRLYQLTRNLQQNLTEHMTGMAHLQVQEDYAHLKDALDIIGSEEIRNYFGGRRQTLWDIIERVVKEGLGIPIPTEAIKTLAIDGNRIFEWIAEFDERAVTNEQFNEFRKAVEAWIIANASLHSNLLSLKSLPLPSTSHNGKGLAGADSVGNDFDDW
ncbi:hypothetical protein [Anabaena azotica]|uniref:Uncharacterized protein n=1 Tax=Anabaena azotica FACHB-119 TaxID=947527 RepID=A0ABR8D7M4_9NOST|nr:hypothetical protein [Anabaena azotica]MBD2503162.1 hypothetical protein [Anabaena azotica FACHB-119]